MEAVKPQLIQSEYPLVAEGIVRRSDRGLCIIGTRIPVFDIMDYLKAGWTREMLLEYVSINEQQLQNALDFIKQGGAELEAAHTEFNRRADEMQRECIEREKKRRAELKAKGLWGKPDLPPHLIPAWEKLQERLRQYEQADEESGSRATETYGARVNPNDYGHAGQRHLRLSRPFRRGVTNDWLGELQRRSI